MQTGTGAELFAREHMRCNELLNSLEQAGWQRQERAKAAGPALELSHQDYAGRIGFIAPYARDFCHSCNRLRVSARGELQMCLFGNAGQSIRHLLQTAQQKAQLQRYFVSLLSGKQAKHNLSDGNVGMRMHLASIGG
jgi:cyclic pyranopterin phosphate synthase